MLPKTIAESILVFPERARGISISYMPATVPDIYEIEEFERNYYRGWSPHDMLMEFEESGIATADELLETNPELYKAMEAAGIIKEGRICDRVHGHAHGRRQRRRTRKLDETAPDRELHTEPSAENVKPLELFYEDIDEYFYSEFKDAFRLPKRSLERIKTAISRHGIFPAEEHPFCKALKKNNIYSVRDITKTVAKKTDPQVASILKKYGIGSDDIVSDAILEAFNLPYRFIKTGKELSDAHAAGYIANYLKKNVLLSDAIKEREKESVIKPVAEAYKHGKKHYNKKKEFTQKLFEKLMKNRKRIVLGFCDTEEIIKELYDSCIREPGK